MWWDAKQKQLTEALREGSAAASSSGKSRRKSTRDSSVSDNELSGDARPSPKRNQRQKANHRESLSSDNESGAESGAGKRQALKNCMIGAKVPRRTNKHNVATAAIKVEPMET
jgi:hypothetical protein